MQHCTGRRCQSLICWASDSGFFRGHWITHLGGINQDKVQMHGNFEGFPPVIVLVWVGNILTPVFVVKKRWYSSKEAVEMWTAAKVLRTQKKGKLQTPRPRFPARKDVLKLQGAIACFNGSSCSMFATVRFQRCSHLFLFVLYKSWGDVSKLFFKHTMAYTGSYKMAHFQNKAKWSTTSRPTITQQQPITSLHSRRRYFAQGARAKGRSRPGDWKKMEDEHPQWKKVGHV